MTTFQTLIVENMDDSTNSAKMPVMCSADCYVADRSKKDWDAADDLYRCKHCRRAIGVIHWFGTEAHSGCVADGIAP